MYPQQGIEGDWVLQVMGSVGSGARVGGGRATNRPAFGETGRPRARPKATAADGLVFFDLCCVTFGGRRIRAECELRREGDTVRGRLFVMLHALKDVAPGTIGHVHLEDGGCAPFVVLDGARDRGPLDPLPIAMKASDLSLPPKRMGRMVEPET